MNERALALLLTVALAACSLGVNAAPPRPWPERPVPCTRSRLLPILDSVAAATTIAGGVLVHVGLERHHELDAQPPGYGALLITSSVLFGAMALWGFQKVGACRRYLSVQPSN